MAKKLTVSAVKKESAKLNKTYKKIVTDMSGNEYEIIINKYFKKTDIPKIITEYTSILEPLKNESFINSFVDATYMFNILIIKYMTNIEMPKDTVELLAFVNGLINIGLLDKIIEALPEEEVLDTMKLLSDSIETMPEIYEKAQEIIELTKVGEENADYRVN